MTRSKQTVTLQVAKQAAVYHGLATLLTQPVLEKDHITGNVRKPRPYPANDRVEQDRMYPRSRAVSSAFPEYPGPTRFPDNRAGMRAQDAANLGRSMPQLSKLVF